MSTMRTLLGAALGALIMMMLAALPASATPEPTGPTFADGRVYAQPYRVGAYRCEARHTDQQYDPCVYDPDPVGDPAPMEPDTGIVLNRDVPRGSQPNGSVAVSDRDDTYGGTDDSVLNGHDCRTMGNGVCGPTNDGGFRPGCYNRNTGAFVQPWRDEWATDQYYRPRECGRPTQTDLAQEDRLNGRVGQLWATTASGGRIVWYVDQPRPRQAVGPAHHVDQGAPNAFTTRPA
jgi:hypothetical protein